MDEKSADALHEISKIVSKLSSSEGTVLIYLSEHSPATTVDMYRGTPYSQSNLSIVLNSLAKKKRKSSRRTKKKSSRKKKKRR